MEPTIPPFWQTSPNALEWTALILFLAWSLFAFVHFTYIKFKHGAEMPLDLERYLVWRARVRAARRTGGDGSVGGGRPPGDRPVGPGEGR